MHALSIKDLHKTYENGFHALKGLSLNIEKGDFFALLGANGAGKSTTIGIISSLVKKTQGEVKVFGRSLDESPNEVKGLIGLVPQEFNCNIFEDCLQILINQAGFYGIPRGEALDSAAYYLEALGLWDKRHNISKELSGGMKRRLMIARALVHQPSMLILDEPTAGVDIEIRHSMWEFLKELNEQGTTIILTTHYLEEAENLCRNIAIIDKGRLVEKSSMQSLLKRAQTQSLVLELSEKQTSLPIFTQFEATLVSADELEVQMSQDISINHVFDELSQHNIAVNHIKNKGTRLENLFLSLINPSEEQNNS